MKNVILDKSLEFAVRIVNLSKFLNSEKKEFVLSKQIIRSGTAIGVLVREAQQAESSADFIHKLSIALKEADETDYWLILLNRTEYLNETQYKSLKENIEELIKLLISIIKSSKENNKK